MEGEFSARDLENQAAIIADTEPARTFDFEMNLLRIGLGRNREIVFQLTLIAVINQVYSGVNALVTDLSIGRNVPAPL